MYISTSDRTLVIRKVMYISILVTSIDCERLPIAM